MLKHLKDGIKRKSRLTSKKLFTNTLEGDNGEARKGNASNCTNTIVLAAAILSVKRGMEISENAVIKFFLAVGLS